eukprot:scaffold2697_cov392-Prasinococcus_capsulatus_cf.AAC.9
MDMLSSLHRPLPVVVVRTRCAGEVVLRIEPVSARSSAQLERQNDPNEPRGWLVTLGVHPLPRIAQKLWIEAEGGLEAFRIVTDGRYPGLH